MTCTITIENNTAKTVDYAESSPSDPALTAGQTTVITCTKDEGPYTITCGKGGTTSTITATTSGATISATISLTSANGIFVVT